MNPHFFTALFTLLSFGSGFNIQGSRGGFAAFFLESGILVSQPSPLGNAIKLSGRTSWLPIGGAPRRGEGAT